MSGHAHTWAIASFADEAPSYGSTTLVRVAYLLCQCGAVLRSVVQQ